MADPDGLPAAHTFTYQWISNDGTTDSDLSGATAQTYDPVAADEGNTLNVRVHFTDNAGNSESLLSAATAAVAAHNRAPVFTSATTFSMAENTKAVGTVTAGDTDSDDHVENFELAGGADLALFAITSAGALSFATAPDYETSADVASTNPANDADNNQYLVVVRVTSGTGSRARTAEQTITVTVTDVPPPAAPVYANPYDNTYTSITPRWNEPADAAAITGYDVRYRTFPMTTDWTTVTDVTTTLSAVPTARRRTTVTGLNPGVRYQIQVRAASGEGSSDWSATFAGTGGLPTDLNEVSFGASSYAVVEDASVAVAVTLAVAHGRSVTIPVTGTGQGGATATDFTVTPGSLTFSATATARTLTVSAPADAEAESGHRVRLAFGSVTAVTAVAPATVTIRDAVTINPRTLTITEADADGDSYTVVLNRQPTGNVTVTISGHAATDLNVSPASLGRRGRGPHHRRQRGRGDPGALHRRPERSGLSRADARGRHRDDLRRGRRRHRHRALPARVGADPRRHAGAG